MFIKSQSRMLGYLAQVAELADALASGASVRKDVGVQVPPWAQDMVVFTKKPGIIAFEWG